jgi:hypothetical protein
MFTKTEIVVCTASYRKVFSASFRRKSFSTATGFIANHMQVTILVTASSASGHFSRVPLGITFKTTFKTGELYEL